MAICGTKSRRRAAADYDERITMGGIMDGDLNSKTTIKMTKIMRRRRPASNSNWRIW